MTDYYKTPQYQRILAAMDRQRAEANIETYARTNGRGGSLYMVEVYNACAEAADERGNLYQQEINVEKGG